MGSVAFFGFIAGPDVTGTVSKEQSLLILGRMARPYLRLTWVCGGLAFLSSFFLAPVEGTHVTVRIVLTTVMFGLSLYLAFGAGAKVRSALRALETAEDGEVPKEALADFDTFQGSSSQISGALLLLGLAPHTAFRPSPPCEEMSQSSMPILRSAAGDISAAVLRDPHLFDFSGIS